MHRAVPRDSGRRAGMRPALPLADAPPPPHYRPRHPERAPTYRVLERHLDDYVYAHEERFEERHGALRKVVPRCVSRYLECGRLQGGFARIRCPTCHDEHLLAFSCRTRNLCPSCQAKRSVLFAERLREEIVSPVSHRHVVFTIPRVLRGLFERERALLGLLARAAYQTVLRVLRAAAGEGRAVPGMVASIQTFGSYANFHPHIHAIVTEGVFTPEGAFHPVPWPPARVLEEAFRRLLLAALLRAERLSESAHESLLAWAHSGFSVHGEQRVDASEGDALERLGRYVTGPALATGAVTLREDGRVCVATPPDPKSGAEGVVLDVLDFVHAVVTQIPDAGKHLVRYYGAYAHKVRGRARAAAANPPVEAAGTTPGASEPSAAPAPCEPVVPAEPGSPEARRRSAWARVLQKVFEVDPLLCPRCGTPMKVVAWITDPVVIERILTHRKRAGLESPFDARGPPQA